ncbi:MAG: response regulator [Candidatus Hydrogenedentota bacterium]
MAKVLLVGEDIGVVDVMASSIEGLGYDVITLYESIDAVETVISEFPDLVIIGEKMNVFNGFEIADALQGDPDVDDELPVLMMTKRSISSQDLARAGIRDTILPEIDPASLREILVLHTGE